MSRNFKPRPFGLLSLYRMQWWEHVAPCGCFFFTLSMLRPPCRHGPWLTPRVVLPCLRQLLVFAVGTAHGAVKAASMMGTLLCGSQPFTALPYNLRTSSRRCAQLRGYAGAPHHGWVKMTSKGLEMKTFITALAPRVDLYRVQKQVEKSRDDHLDAVLVWFLRGTFRETHAIKLILGRDTRV